MTTTARAIVTSALRLLGVIDQTEDPTADELANGVAALNNLLRAEHQDGASQYLIDRVTHTLPAGAGEFHVGVADAAHAVQRDAVGIRRIDVADVGPHVRREIAWAPMRDITRTTFPGMITKAHQERRGDDSVRVSVWQRPRRDTPLLIEYGGRVPLIATADADVPLPSEGVLATSYLLARKLMSSYGRDPNAVAVVIADAEKYAAQWNSYARGQQWIILQR